jgi:hypothetical protein
MGLFNMRTKFVEHEELKDLKIQIKALIKEKRELKEELEDLKLKKRLEAEEIKHMTRINEERLKQEVETEKLELKKKYQDDINVFKEEQRQQLVTSLREFHDKMEKQFKNELDSFKEMHKVIIERLPNVNYDITQHVGGPRTIEHMPDRKKRR